MNLVEKVDINGLISKHESDYYYKSFKTRTHLFTMLFGILSRCDSMTEICEGLRAMGGKLNHLGMDQAPAKSTACDGLRTEATNSLKNCILPWSGIIRVFCRTAELLD